MLVTHVIYSLFFRFICILLISDFPPKQCNSSTFGLSNTAYTDSFVILLMPDIYTFLNLGIYLKELQLQKVVVLFGNGLVEMFGSTVMEAFANRILSKP